MTLSIIIPTYKRILEVERLLQSVAIQEFPSKDLQILLISNFKNKYLRQKVSYWKNKFFDFQYREMGLKGVNKARNMGIRFARGDILYFLDDDCLLAHKGHLQNVVQAHKKQPDAMGIGGDYKSFTTLKAREKFYQENTSKWLKKSIGLANKSSQLLGGNASYKKEVFNKGYYFDPLIVFGGSEESFNQSLKDYTLLFDKNLWVYHQIKMSFLTFIKKSFKQGLGSANKGHKDKTLNDFKKEWAFLHEESFSFYSLCYNIFFKLGYFWGLSSFQKNNIFFKFCKFFFLVLKSRGYFIGKHLGYLYGQFWSLFLGPLWYGIGYLYGQFWSLFLGPLWYGIGYLYGQFWRVCISPVWYIFYHSPPMKIYYFSKYQYHKRIKPRLTKKRSDSN